MFNTLMCQVFFLSFSYMYWSTYIQYSDVYMYQLLNCLNIRLFRAIMTQDNGVLISKWLSNICYFYFDRVFSAITTEEDLRGIVVQQGGAKVIRQVQYSCTLHTLYKKDTKCTKKQIFQKGTMYLIQQKKYIQEEYLIKENKNISTETFYKENIE